MLSSQALSKPSFQGKFFFWQIFSPECCYFSFLSGYFKLKNVFSLWSSLINPWKLFSVSGLTNLSLLHRIIVSRHDVNDPDFKKIRPLNPGYSFSNHCTYNSEDISHFNPLLPLESYLQSRHMTNRVDTQFVIPFLPIPIQADVLAPI
jgi:hypothetical protein